MIREYDHVRIKKNGMTGQVVDIRNTDKTYYLVETCTEKKNGDNAWNLYDCAENEIETINA